MTEREIEDLLERFAKKVHEDQTHMFAMYGFNTDPSAIHEEQQMVAFMRSMYTGSNFGKRAMIGAMITALVGWAVWLFTGHRPPGVP